MEESLQLLTAIRSSHARVGSPLRVLLAVSGGADSLALMLSMAEFKSSLAIELTCCHVNHGLRDSSDAEEALVKEIAKTAGFNVIIKKVKVPKAGNLEANAREARYNALQEAAKEVNAEAIALAHHANDQAETLLMHLMRGTGPEGFTGMLEWRQPFWRPFLTLEKETLLHFLRSRNQSWAEDESNQDQRFLRNHLRLSVFPLLEKVSPGVSQRMARACRIMGDEQADWNRRVNAWLNAYARLESPFYFLLLAPFYRESLAMKRRILRAVCQSAGSQLDYEQTEALLAFVSHPAGETVNLPGNSRALLSSSRLHILPDAVKSVKVAWPQPRFINDMTGLGDGKTRQLMDGDAIQDARMRQGEPGDLIRPLGMKGSQPLRKYLAARGIDEPFRSYWPVFARGHEVFWVPGCGISGLAAVREDSRQRTGLEFVGRLPQDISKMEDQQYDT